MFWDFICIFSDASRPSSAKVSILTTLRRSACAHALSLINTHLADLFHIVGLPNERGRDQVHALSKYDVCVCVCVRVFARFVSEYCECVDEVSSRVCQGKLDVHHRASSSLSCESPSLMCSNVTALKYVQ
jgi:hypothetical protein